MKISDRLPYETPRSQQIDVLDMIEKNWPDKKFFIVEAPTGTGKSGVSIAVSAHAKNAYLLTSTKVLQDQYVEEFDKVLKSLKGKGNYTCKINPYFTPETAPCQVVKQQMDFCISNSICPYYNARNAALAAPTMLTSYAYYLSAVECGPLSEKRCPDWVQRVRGTIICDEGHELTGILTDFSTVLLDPDELSTKFGVELMSGIVFTEDGETAIAHVDKKIKETLAALQHKIENTMSNAAKWFGNDVKNVSKEAASQVAELVRKRDELDRLSRRLSWYVGGAGGDSWLISPLDNGRTVKISPTKPRDVFYNFIVPMAERVVIMSATMGSPETIMDELGLPRDKTVFISTDSPFDPAKSPVEVLGNLDLSYKRIDASLQEAVDTVAAILDNHPNEKGIIHTGNYKVTRAILERSSPHIKKRLVGKAASRDGDSNEELVRLHKESAAPTVLISPSMQNGVDLKGDHSRFQVVVKLPWMNTSEPIVAHKMKVSKNWYANEMIKKLIQACGRSTRTEDDHSHTYILDSSFRNVLKRNVSLFPKWFKDRII